LFGLDFEGLSDHFYLTNIKKLKDFFTNLGYMNRINLFYMQSIYYIKFIIYLL